MNSIKHSIKNAFTITETVIVVAVIGILMTAMTIYLDGSGERSKIIEAEGCAATLDGEIQNYMYYALTSKKLKVGDNYDQEVSPNSYHIYLTGGNITFNGDGTIHLLCNKAAYESSSAIYCDEIALGYYTGSELWPRWYDIVEYKKLSSSKTCKQNNSVKLIFRYGQNLTYLTMKKGYSKMNGDDRPFSIGRAPQAGGGRLFRGDIRILACMGPNCEKEARKEIGKREIDARSQTIALKKCKFYKDDNPMLCETRED